MAILGWWKMVAPNSPPPAPAKKPTHHGCTIVFKEGTTREEAERIIELMRVKILEDRYPVRIFKTTVP